MTGGGDARTRAAGRARAQVNGLRAAILRWNRQFNLVSRDGTAVRLDALIEHCQRGAIQIWDDLADQRRESLAYLDLGSGGGLPALVWLPWFRAWGHRGPAWLIEPRDKRAWFLERTARALGLADVTVVARRWGEADPGQEPAGADRSPPVGDILVSLKALRLTDEAVLAGLDVFLGEPATPAEGRRTVTIVRFLGEEGEDGAPRDRALLETGERWRPDAPRQLAAPGLRLSVHRYHAG